MKQLLTSILLTLAIFMSPAAFQPTAVAKPAAKEKIAIVDINRADAATLQTVPGIGTQYSKKIIDGRPYKSKDELWRRKILPKGVYENVKDYLIAKSMK
jgi:competence protein ComEA